ncbi:MAG: serine/threonine protein kinase, partial [Acidobacteriota bacterium]
MADHDVPTDLFVTLTPERVLDAVEHGGLETRPVCYPLNSFENRVYEVELADRSRVVAKFYRPGRWSEAQILEEHAFLTELAEEEIPVCEVRPFPDGSTVQTVDGIHYSLWDRKAGRAPDELDDTSVQRLGAFVGRMHAVAGRRRFEHRPRLDADRYVRRPIAFLERRRMIARAYERRYLAAAEGIAEIADRELRGVETLRLHGDLHLGNVLFRDGLLRVLDFDDGCTGPAVQDLWLALPGRDGET